MNYTILIADDESEIRDLLKLYLEKDGYQVLEAGDGREALSVCRKQEVDLVVVDIMMPKMDGFTLIKELRGTSNIPVIVLSSRSSDADKILGLELGADDYITKPFNPLEAAARIHSNIRRFYSLGSREKTIPKLQVQDLILDTESCLLYRGESTIELTSVEYHLMQLFMEYPGKVFTKQQLFEAGWGETYMVDDNSIMVCISKLRTKLAQNGKQYIKTIRGLGYRLERE